MASQESFRINRLYKDYFLLSNSELAVVAGSACKTSDPTSTLSDTHLLEITYTVDLRLQHPRQQLQFQKIELHGRDEWIAREMASRNQTGNEERRQFYQSMISLDLCPSSMKQASTDEQGVRVKTVMISIKFYAYNPRSDDFTGYPFTLPVTIPYRAEIRDNRLFEFDALESLLDGTKVPRGIPNPAQYRVEAFQAVYCHPDISV